MAIVTEESTSKRIKTRNWDIHYHEAGEGHPLVLVHGGGPGASAWSNYNPNIATLARKYRVLAVDLPGWGKSQAVTYDRRDNSGALAEFLEALGISQAAFVGNSMGGALLARAAIQPTPLFDAVVTIEDVTNAKPAPDLFLEAARRMEALPQTCVVFEDSREGLEAARRAGMVAIDVATLGSAASSVMFQC